MMLLEYLENRCRLNDGLIVTYDELAEYQTKEVEGYQRDGILVKIDDADGIYCRECDSHCWKEVILQPHYKTQEIVATYYCEEEDTCGMKVAKLEHLQQWKIDKRKLWKQLYGFDSEWQVPWEDDNPAYISLQEAENLASDDTITVKKLSRLLKEPDFPIHHMHKGMRCNVHLGDFRKWLDYARYGKITDEAIERYLEGIKNRKENVDKKKCREKANQKR